MRIVHWDPFQDVISLQDRMNRLFEQTQERSIQDREGTFASTWVPAVDIYETPDSVVLQAELPGQHPIRTL